MGKNKHKHEKFKQHSREFEGGGGIGMSPPPVGLVGVPKLIVKLGSDMTPERVESPGDQYPQQDTQFHYHHRHKEKKKKKKKEKKKRDEKDRDREHRHHHHKKKKKREYDSGEGEGTVPPSPAQQMYGQPQPPVLPVGVSDGGGGSLVGVGGPPCKVPKLESDSESVGSVGAMMSPKREIPPRSCASTLKQKSTMLCKVLEHLLAMLERKDVSNFFSQPVSDTFAPGYSQIIREPMDFSTMNEKIEEGKYENLGQFRRDFELICNNCMVYNTPETVYHKAAKRLLQQGQRILAHDRIRALAEHIPMIQELTPEHLGFDIKTELPAEMSLEDEKDISKVIEEIRGNIRRPPGRFEAIPDNMTPDEIASQARGAARLAADRLQRRKPGSQMGYLRQKPDGTTSLSIVTPSADQPGEKTVTLGQLIGRVKNGASTLQGFKEDRRNCVKAFNPIYYGAFSSYGPAYDSTFANLTKQETELVYSTYGDDVGVAYAESIKNFSKNCEYATFIVDHLLDILTGNEHKKTSKYIEEQKTLRSEESLVKAAFDSSEKSKINSSSGSNSEPSIDFDSLRTLAKEGIDMSFLESIQTEYNKVQVSAGVRLEKNAALLESLRDVQHQRLSGPPPQHLGQVTGPSAEECAISDRVQQNLVNLVAETRPKDVFIQGARS